VQLLYAADESNLAAERTVEYRILSTWFLFAAR
jgi:hypothetical protein